MENKIRCPNCNKTISNNSVIDDADNGVGSVTQSIKCDCGEEITYWQITTMLRDQRYTESFYKWFRSYCRG